MTLDQLLAIMPALPRDRALEFIDPLNSAMEKFKIDTPVRVAAFIAQVAHESGCLRYVREIASGAAYDGRADLGNTKAEAIAAAAAKGTTPGPFYKGRGLIQVTGYDNFAACSQVLFNDRDVLTSHPELLESKQFACLSAAWFWWSRGLNNYADAGLFEKITRRINGGLNGLADREGYWKRAKRALYDNRVEPAVDAPVFIPQIKITQPVEPPPQIMAVVDQSHEPPKTIVTNVIDAFTVGKELANAETWKKGQVLGSRLAVFLTAVVGVARAYGYDFGLTDAQLLSIGTAVAGLVGVLNEVATTVSTSRIGMRPRGDVLPDVRADGNRNGNDSRRADESHWTTRHYSGDDSALSDMRSRG